MRSSLEKEDNSFWNLTNDLYNSMRDNYIEKVKMSQKFDSDEFAFLQNPFILLSS